jgi:hypothetical protein
MKTVTIRARAFKGQGIKQHQCSVDSDGTVRVWDSVAGYYTTCHSLSAVAAAKVRDLASR